MRYALIGVLAIAALCAASLSYVRSIDFDRYRPQLVEELRQATGREVAVDGPIRLALWPVPRFTLSGVAIANAPWGRQPAFADVERVEAEIAPMPLLQGELRIGRLVLVRPELWFETDPFGKVNWVLAGGPLPVMGEAAKSRGGSSGMLSALAVTHIDVAGGRLSYRDGATGDVTVVSVASASIGGGGHGAGLKMTFDGAWNTLPISLRGAIGPHNAVASHEGNATEIRFVLEAAEAGLFVEGTVGDPRAGPGARLQVAGKAAALDGVAAMLGLSLPRATPVSLNTDLRYRHARLELSAIDLVIGGQSATGALAVDFSGSRPYVTADLRATAVDFTRLAVEPADALSGKAGLVESLVSSGVLAHADGEADIRADTLQAGAITLHDAEAQVVLKDGELLADPLRARFSDGARVEGSFRVAGNATPARLTLSLKVPALAIGPALQRLGTVKAFGGVASVAARLSTVAGRPDEMLAALQGEALLAMGEGRLTLEPYGSPSDMAAAGLGGLAGLVVQNGRRDVAVECVAGRVTVDAGVASAGGFVLLTEDARLKGEGTIDLTTGRLALRFTPESRGGELIAAQPVSVTGTVANPKLTPQPGSVTSLSDMALYPIRRLFAGLAAEPAANACLRALPPIPGKRRLDSEPAAQQRQGEVQEAVAPREALPPAPKPRSRVE